MHKNIIKTWPLAISAALMAVTLQAKPAKERDLGAEFDQPVEINAKAHAGKPHEGLRGKMDPGRNLLRFADRLNLSDEQEVQILKLSQQFKNDMDANVQSSKGARETLKEMRENKAFDEDTFREAMAVIQPSMIEGMVIHAKYMESLGEVLTEEQQAQVEEMRSKLKERGERRHEAREDRIEKWKKRGEVHGQRGL